MVAVKRFAKFEVKVPLRVGGLDAEIYQNDADDKRSQNWLRK